MKLGISSFFICFIYIQSRINALPANFNLNSNDQNALKIEENEINQKKLEETHLSGLLF